MGFVARLITTSLAIVIVAYLLPGVIIDNALSAIGLAIVLGLLNIFLKPVLVFLTLPITVFTLGLFLLVINALILMLAAKIVPGFYIQGFWWAVLFSVILSIVVSILESIAGLTDKKE
jgi:putative membrane protein